jgi:hypothetical protein
LMDERRGFRGDDLEDGAGGRADSEISEHIAPGNSPQQLKPVGGQAHTARLKSCAPELQEFLHKLQGSDQADPSLRKG